jgi:hypothetical protein
MYSVSVAAYQTQKFFQKKESILPTLWNVKSMLKRLFGSEIKKGVTPSGEQKDADEASLLDEIEQEQCLQKKRHTRKSI